MTKLPFRFIFFLLMCFALPLTATAQTVNLPDPNLRAVVENALGKAAGTPITADEMATLTQLDAPNANISNLTGLEHATNLTRLYLRKNSISDISAVAGLTKLTYLYLGWNSISDISPVAGLTNLGTLLLWYNSISDISAVAGLANLGTLYLEGNSISDISPVAGLTNLGTLDLWDNSISDISPVAGLTNLGTLNLGWNSISDISPVAGLTNLRQLYLWYNSISDISAVAGLTNLTRLALRENNISDISAVTGLTNLTYLDLLGNSISDISAVAGLTNLARLDLDHNFISDISPVAGLTNLTELYLWGERISDISALVGLTNLTHLKLWIHPTSDISALTGLTNMTWLNIGLHNYAGGSNIGDISVLAGLTNMTELYLTGNLIKDISALVGLTNLTHLSLTCSGLSDISVLVGLTNLTEVKLRTNISDLSPLVANTGLGSGDTVDVRENPLSYKSIKTHIPALQSRGVTVQFEDRTHLAVGEPYTVRLIYLLPSDRQPKPDIDTQMDTLIKEVQRSYADAMESYGFGRKTFRFETDATGKAVVHHVNGQFTADYYEEGTFGKVEKVIEEQFDTQRNIYLVVVDSGYLIDGAPGIARIGDGASGIAVINNMGHLSAYVYLASHELRHTFGLKHDFRIDTRGFTFKISKCTAEFLDVHRYFNPDRQGQNFARNIRIKMLPPSLASPSNAIRLHFEMTDAEGMHQAQLLASEVKLTSGKRAGGFLACKQLNSTSSTVEFVTTALTPKNDSVYLRIMDVHGSISQSQSYPIDVASLLPPPPEYLWTIPAGINWIHVPLEVTTVEGIEKPIESIADLYDALGGAAGVSYLTTYDPQQGWFSYFGPSDKGTVVDKALANDTGVIAKIKTPVSLRLKGAPWGTNGRSTITLHPGQNLVGIPLRDSRITRVSDLFALEGVSGNVSVVIVLDNGAFKWVRRAGDDGDIPVTGGQSFVLTAQAAATVAISGEGWTNMSGTAAAPLRPGLQVTDTTPMLALKGSITSPEGAWDRLLHLRPGSRLGSGFRVKVKNLSAPGVDREATIRSVGDTGSEDKGVDYRLTIVNIETGRVARIGDTLEVSAQPTNPFVGVEPLWYTVTVEDVKRSWIQLPALVAYEIPSETELLANYPNPFNPETWIPYRLAEDGFVTLTIYDTAGQVVRTLEVGHRIAAVYERRAKAIHWDGRNDLGEGVASGIYFYTLSAGDYSATRKMVILK